LDWIEVGVPLAFLAAFLGLWRIAAWLFPDTGPKQEGSRTVYPAQELLKAGHVGLGGAFVFLAGYLVFSHPAWATVPAALAAFFLLTPPTDIVLDETGVSQARFYLLPHWQRSMRWDEVDSAYEEIVVVPTRDVFDPVRRVRVAFVSAGPNRVIRFSGSHAGLDEFLDQLEARGVHVGRISVQ
jgi:hypothetical protein